jgi:hypothetical protein
MKKILFVLVVLMTMCFSANAQSDGFFKSGGSENYSGRTETPTPLIPGTAPGTTPDSNAPLGSGLIILTVAGAGYAVMRRKK